MIAFGSSKIAKAKCSTSLRLGIASTIFYLPMIWQRFNYSYTDVSESIYFDLWIIAILLVSLLCKPNKSLNQN